MNDFYIAYNWLREHPAFFIVDEKGRIPYADGFESNLSIEVVLVNPETNCIDDNKKLNTKTRVWLECGPYIWEKDFNFRASCHDIDLDCGGDSFEEAIIELSKLVRRKYGDYNPEATYAATRLPFFRC